MNTYVISDIHGCYDDFIDMLKQIDFSDKDQLILAGDYIDRGIQNFEMLKWLENSSYNVVAIKGNHEVEFSQCISIMSSLIKKLNVKVKNSIKRFISPPLIALFTGIIIFVFNIKTVVKTYVRVYTV